MKTWVSKALNFQSQNLRRTHDLLLLPRLLSGQVNLTES
jgi:hypothetical protein